MMINSGVDVPALCKLKISQLMVAMMFLSAMRVLPRSCIMMKGE